MEKQHLFNLLSFICSVLALEVIGVNAGFAYAIWLFIINVAFQYLYFICKTDKEEEI